MTKLTQGGWVALLLVAICLGWYSSMLASRLDASQNFVKEQGKSLAQQAGLINTLQTQDAQNRALMSVQLEREQQLRKEASVNERKLRDALNNDECARRTAPDAVIDLLRGTDTAASANSSTPP